jgi:hypothetical protein
MIIGGTACGTNGVISGTEANESTNGVEDNTELEQPPVENNMESNEAVQTQEDEEKIYTALQKGDFSYFAGTYKPCAVYDDLYGGGEHLPDLFLQENGIITGGLVYGSYPETKPTTVEINEDGSYLCQVHYSSNADQGYFVIYPQGVIGENPYIYNDPFLTDTPYIHYISIDGGVSDIIYYKIEG